MHVCSPVPKVPVPLNKRGKQSAAILNKKETICCKKNIEAKKGKGKTTPYIPCKNKRRPAESDIQKKGPAKSFKKRPRKILSSDEISTEHCDESDTKKDSECTECFE